MAILTVIGQLWWWQMMHSNPFSSTGYDISDLQRQVSQKADSYEVSALRSSLDRVEHSVDMGRDEHRREVDELRSRCERLGEGQRRLEEEIAELRALAIPSPHQGGGE